MATRQGKPAAVTSRAQGKGAAGAGAGAKNGKRQSKNGGPPEISRRVRVPNQLPAPPETLELPWAQSREAFNGIDPGELTHIISESPRYQDTVGSACTNVDLNTASPQARAYTTFELETLNLLRRVLGLRSYRETRDWLTSDRGARARELLGFDDPERIDYSHGPRKLMRGIPSEATMTRHHKRFPDRVRQRAWQKFFRAGRKKNLEDLSKTSPEELLFAAVDGTVMRTHYTAPIRDPKTGDVVNAGSVTAPEAGYKARSNPDADPDSYGHGFQDVHVLVAGLPMIYETTAINYSERNSLIRGVEAEWEAEIKPYLPAGKLPVFDADGGFFSPRVSKLIHGLGGVPRIHHRSHAEAETTKNAVAKDRKTIWAIDGYEKWKANGLRELFCVCGNGRTFKRFAKTKAGKAVARVEGSCKVCGSISITAGDWRVAQNPRRFVKCVYAEDRAKADWSFGNPLTYSDPLANAYGRKRFATIEGFHGVLERRFSLIKGKRWIRQIREAELEVTMVFSIIHELAIQGRALALRNGHGASQGASMNASGSSGNGAGPPPGG